VRRAAGSDYSDAVASSGIAATGDGRAPGLRLCRAAVFTNMAGRISRRSGTRLRMSKAKSSKKKLDAGEKKALRVVAQVRILDSCEHLRDMQWQMRRHAHGLAKSAKLRVIPDVAVRELLATLKKRDLNLADQIADIRENLDVANGLLGPTD
jgi:hypothetical protein